jgi:hypothetical protein
MSADATMPVSVVVERRKSDHPWQDYTWRPIGVLPRAAPDPWKLIAEGDDWAHFLAGSLKLELFRRETEGYLANLSRTPPLVYVVLRRAEGTGEMDVEPFHATVCPYEAIAYDKGGDDIVDGAPMPPEVLAWVAEFVERYHVDVPFQKRKNRRHDDDTGEPGARDRRTEEAS